MLSQVPAHDTAEAHAITTQAATELLAHEKAQLPVGYEICPVGTLHRLDIAQTKIAMMKRLLQTFREELTEGLAA